MLKVSPGPINDMFKDWFMDKDGANQTKMDDWVQELDDNKHNVEVAAKAAAEEAAKAAKAAQAAAEEAKKQKAIAEAAKAAAQAMHQRMSSGGHTELSKAVAAAALTPTQTVLKTKTVPQAHTGVWPLGRTRLTTMRCIG